MAHLVGAEQGLPVNSHPRMEVATLWGLPIYHVLG